MLIISDVYKNKNLTNNILRKKETSLVKKNFYLKTKRKKFYKTTTH